MDQMCLIDTYITIHTTVAEYVFFTSVHKIFFSIHHILGHKANFNKFGTLEIIPYIFSDHDGIKLEMNNIEVVEILQMRGG